MLETLEKIMKIYGETGSLEGTYDLFLKIKQGLERLVAINKVWHDNEPTESVDINANHLQELYDLTNKLTQENEILKMSVKDTYDSANDMIFELLEELKKLKTLDNERVELLGNLNAELSITEKENKELWQQIENYNHKFAEVERKKCDLILEKEKIKSDLIFIFKHFSLTPNSFDYDKTRNVYYFEEFSFYVELTQDQFETYKKIFNEYKEVLSNEV